MKTVRVHLSVMAIARDLDLPRGITVESGEYDAVNRTLILDITAKDEEVLDGLDDGADVSVLMRTDESVPGAVFAGWEPLN